ncbi:MAG TPA: nitronate monooxygenase [Dehalococcoidia bacterium]|nr:nitronate monooxygenase [Dehalococcoidia bacterium]
MLNTRITEMFGIEYPIMSAPMAMHSGGRLAAAVSKAGGLGSFGAIHISKGPDWLRGEIDYVRSETDRPFGVGFITNFIPMFQAHFDATMEARPPLVALSFGEPERYIDRARAAGARVVCQVQTFAAAKAAVSGGTDILVAQGNEAGGHTGTMNLLPFLVRLAEAFPETPLMAAGGISSGRALAAVLAAGADGAWAGTAFMASPEAVEVREGHKEKILASDGEDTVFTGIFDKLSGAPWPQGIGGRVWKNRLVEEWTGRENEVPENREAIAARYMAGVQDFDADVLDLYMGQGAAAVTAVRPAAEVLHTICDDAERIVRERSSQILK